MKKLAAALFALSVLGMLCGGAAGQTASTNNEPSRQPILRIETGMHTAPIRRISVDAANRYLVTASHDKTARVWELATGKLLRVLRPPIGEGHEGKLYAVAISPDGRTVAVGGVTGVQVQPGQLCFYLFDRESGRLVRRIAGLPNVVLHLVYSPNGRWLAASFGEGGIRVYETGGYAQVGEDRDYGAESFGADFDVAGRVVTSCLDGFIRLYERTGVGALRLVAKRKVEGGRLPFSVSLAPDGSSVAVGFQGSTKVAVLSGRDLSLQFAPDNGGVNNGSLDFVTWSADGQTLSAGGTYKDDYENKIICQWAEGGRGRYREIKAARNTIQHLLPLRDGGVIYGASDPAFGLVDAGGQRSLFIGPAIADYRGLLQGFLLSTDGAVVQFSYEKYGKSPARFSLADRRFEEASSSAPTLKPPLITGLAVTDWNANYAPKLGGQALKLEQHEVSFSLAIAPDQSRFLLGTAYLLRLYSNKGKELWEVAIPSVAWSVNISGNGKLVVAAFADGTIRWYRMSDGKELLAFYPHNDRKRWVVWTQQGYYDAAPGAEDLIGWHVNNGKDQAADFFPVGQFRSVYYRPDVISRVLTVGDEAEALRLANEEAGRKRQEADLLKRLPPVVSIIAPADGADVSSTTVTVRYTVRMPSGEPVTAVKALVNGRPVNEARGQGVTQAAGQSLQVTIPERDCELALIAENQYAASVPAVVRIRWRGRVVAEEFVIKPKLYVLAVGVSKYANPAYNLSFAAKDARDFTTALHKQKGGLYQDVIVKVLADDQATKDGVLDGFDWILRQTTSKDVAMILLAGHGENDNYGDYFFCPHNIDSEKTLRTGVPFTEIKKTVERLAGKVIVFVDTCRSGNVFGTATRRGAPDIVGLVNELASAENGAVVFAASTGRQVSLERAEWGNGAFTKAVIEGLNGGADFKRTGKVTVNMLDAYISERVKELTGGKQTPTTTKPKTVPDFPIAVRR